jgi:hypothetical protein
MRTLTKIPSRGRGGAIAQLVCITALVTVLLALLIGSNSLRERLTETRNELLNQTEELNETRRELREAIARLDAQTNRTATGVDEITKSGR